MARTITERRISMEEQIKLLQNQCKQLLQKEKEEERKARTHRICKLGGLLERLLPDINTLTDEQKESFLKTTLLSTFARRKLDSIKSQIEKTDEPTLAKEEEIIAESAEPTTSDSEAPTS